MCRQIPDRPFPVVRCVFLRAPHCVALKSLESNQKSAMADPPTILRFSTSRWCAPSKAMPRGHTLSASTMTRVSPEPTSAAHPRKAQCEQAVGCAPHPPVTTGPRHGFRLVAGVPIPRRSWRHTAPTTVTPARTAPGAAATLDRSLSPRTRTRTHVHTRVTPH